MPTAAYLIPSATSSSSLKRAADGAAAGGASAPAAEFFDFDTGAARSASVTGASSSVRKRFTATHTSRRYEARFAMGLPSRLSSRSAGHALR